MLPQFGNDSSGDTTPSAEIGTEGCPGLRESGRASFLPRINLLPLENLRKTVEVEFS
jgi:hypothetical protein